MTPEDLEQAVDGDVYELRRHWNQEEVGREFEESGGDVIARTREIARWRETGEVAYQQDIAVRLTLDDEKIVKVVVMPGEGVPS
jgi:hypothetical protein